VPTGNVTYLRFEKSCIKGLLSVWRDLVKFKPPIRRSSGFGTKKASAFLSLLKVPPKGRLCSYTVSRYSVRSKLSTYVPDSGAEELGKPTKIAFADSCLRMEQAFDGAICTSNVLVRRPSVAEIHSYSSCRVLLRAVCP
jgi:hypothetical protein